MILLSFQFFKEKVADTTACLLIERTPMRNFKARIIRLEKNIKPGKSRIRFTGLMAHLLANIGLKTIVG